jgi:drug/metabolite transporter (DMT)-like permease
MNAIALYFALLAPALYGLANVLDNFLVGKVFKNIPALIFYSELLNLLFIPLVWLVQRPHLPSLSMLPIFLAIGACDLLYLYPYYKALQADDTAVVSSLFSLGKIFVPLLAVMIVGEVLQISQYAGFGLVIISNLWLTVDLRRHHWRLRPAFFYMLLASFLVSLEVVLYKYLLERVDWGTGFVSAVLAGFMLSLSLLLMRPTRHRIVSGWGTFRKRFGVIALQEFFTISASASYTYATASLPATVVSGVGESQAFIVLMYALGFSKTFPRIFKEKIDGRSVLKKMVLFGLTVVGVWLIIR